MSREPDAPRARSPISILGPAALTVLLMSYPWLSPGLQGRAVWGLPLTLAYFFAVWAIAIAIAAAWRVDT